MTMKSCSKCGSICLPRKEDGNVVYRCKCGHVEQGSGKIVEKVNSRSQDIGVVETKTQTLPIVKIRCPECGHDEAANWEIQTRSPDEAATQFFKCNKCGYTWREYR